MNIKNKDLTYGRGYVYSLQYHIIWCTKYRRKVLKDEVADDCKALLYSLAEEYRFEILAMEVMPDHIHHTTVFYSGHDQNHEGRDCEETVPPASGDQKQAVGRTSVEPFLLRGDSE